MQNGEPQLAVWHSGNSHKLKKNPPIRISKGGGTDSLWGERELPEPQAPGHAGR